MVFMLQCQLKTVGIRIQTCWDFEWLKVGLMLNGMVFEIHMTNLGF